MSDAGQASEIVVHYDEGRCAGYGNCELVAPGLFKLDDDTGKAVLLADRVSAEQRKAVEQAVQNCPTEAISIEPANHR